MTIDALEEYKMTDDFDEELAEAKALDEDMLEGMTNGAKAALSKATGKEVKKDIKKVACMEEPKKRNRKQEKLENDLTKQMSLALLDQLINDKYEFSIFDRAMTKRLIEHIKQCL